MFANHETNLTKAERAWAVTLPEWVRLLANVCDRTSQRQVAERLKLNSGTVSKIIGAKYPGDLREMETLVRSTFSADQVLCPVWAERIPLKSCVRTRRRRLPPDTETRRIFARTCPTCSNNTDEES